MDAAFRAGSNAAIDPTIGNVTMTAA